jgi:hypothetical protein
VCTSTRVLSTVLHSSTVVLLYTRALEYSRGLSMMLNEYSTEYSTVVGLATWIYSTVDSAVRVLEYATVRGHLTTVE